MVLESAFPSRGARSGRPSPLRRVRWLLVLVWLVTCLGGGAPLTAQTPVFRVAVNPAPPYRIIEDGRFSGLYIDAFREIARLAGFQAEFLEVPMARALVMMADGSADVMLGPNPTAERAAYLAFTRAQFPREAKAFYTRPGTPSISQYSDLAGKTIAVVRGAVYFDPFDSDPSLRKEEVSNYEAAFRKVAGSRNDVAIAPELEGDYLVRTLGLALNKGKFRAEGRPSPIAISKKSAAVAFQTKIEAAMERLRANGTWDQILSRYR